MRIFESNAVLSFSDVNEMYFHSTQPSFTWWQRVVKWWYRQWYSVQLEMVPS